MSKNGVAELRRVYRRATAWMTNHGMRQSARGEEVLDVAPTPRHFSTY